MIIEFDFYLITLVVVLLLLTAAGAFDRK